MYYFNVINSPYFFNLFLFVRSLNSTGGLGTIVKYLGVESSCHKYLVRLFVHDKGKPRKVKEENLTRSFRGYSSFEDVIEVEERRKLRTSSDRVEIRDLRIERRMMKREAKELRMKIEILKKQSSNLAREKEEWRKEMKELQVCNLFSWKRPAGNETFNL